MHEEQSHNDAIPPGLAALIARAEPAGRRPPVERWNPPRCGEIDMRISRDGQWFYRGSPIGREALVRLFASVLRREPGGRFCLVTPVEKLAIVVEDVPFLAVELFVTDPGPDQVMTVRTNVGDVVAIGSEHPMRFGPDAEALEPYVTVRHGLEARLARPLAYELVDHGSTAERDGEPWFGVRSGGAFFPIMRSGELERLAR